MTTRRENIQNVIGSRFNPVNANASLWFDKFIFDSRKNVKGEAASVLLDTAKKDETAKSELVRQVISIKEPAIYKNYFDNVWQPNLQKFGAKCQKARVKNRLAIKLGAESVLETSISLHRLFGVPFIPGSSLKGLVSHFLHQYGGNDWKRESDYHTVIFGNQENAGFITFYDALYVPDSGYKGRALYADVMTTHHQDYYGEKTDRNKQPLPPADWDSPIPVSFISATGEYLIALSGPADWVELTFEILGYALATDGVGAKTSSGYGRMAFSGGFILSEAEIEEKKSARFEALFAEMEKLVNADKETRKETNKKLKSFTKTLEPGNEAHRKIAQDFDEKAEKLGIKSSLLETNPEWFQQIQIILKD